MSRLALFAFAITSIAAACAGAPSGNSNGAGTGWTAATDTSAFDHAMVADVTAGGPGFVAVGNVAQNGDTNGAIWTSADGVTWRATAVDAPKATFFRVGRAAGGLLAFGSTCPGTGECIGVTFWSSPDGVTWTPHGSNPCCWVVAFASGSFGVVGVGTDWTNFQHQAETDVAAYVSTDGATWTRSSNDPSFLNATMGAVAPGGPGLVAVGNGPASLVAWTSADGVTWSAEPATDALGRGEVRDMLAFGSNVVAVGRDSSGAVAWKSADGVMWSRTPSGAAGLDGAIMERLATTGSQLVAVGQDSSVGGIWTSTDGATWSKVQAVPGTSTELSAVAASDASLVAFGSTASRSVVLLHAELGH